MRHTTRAAIAMTTGVLALGAGGLAPAIASPGVSSHRCGYPPGACQVYFNHGSYHRGATVKFASDPAFGKREKLAAHLHCRHGFSQSEGTFRAHNHRGIGSFTLPEETPKGGCTLTLTGQSSGNSASGHFTAKH